MYDQIIMERIQELRGAPVLDPNGDKIGSVEEVFLDGQTHQPEWIGLGTGFFGTKRVLVPVAGASLSHDAVTVRYPKDQVKDAPDVDADYLTAEDEQALYSYYGIPYGTSSSDTVLPEGERDFDRQVDLEDADRQAVTRHEEELRVGTREVEAGRLRLHKWVETEQVEVPVEVKKEKARVYREPVDGETAGERSATTRSRSRSARSSRSSRSGRSRRSGSGSRRASRRSSRRSATRCGRSASTSTTAPQRRTTTGGEAGTAAARPPLWFG